MSLLVCPLDRQRTRSKIRFLCGVLFSVLTFIVIGCVSTPDGSYDKVSLSAATLSDVKGFIENGKPEKSIQFIQALHNEKIDVSVEELDLLFRESVSLLTKQFNDAFLVNDYFSALSKLHSLKNIGHGDEIKITEKEILTGAVRKYIAQGKAVPGLTLLQRILAQYELSTEQLRTFAETGVKEKNTAVCSQIEAALLKKGEEIPKFLKTYLQERTDFSGMIKGVATIWVNRGIKIEGGVGYPERAIGSGFFIDKEGYLLTNYHVISSEVDPEYEGFSRLYIKSWDDPTQRIPAKVVGYDPIFDIALLKVEIVPDFVFSLSDERTFLPGQQLYAIGTPIGLENTITSGIVSAKGRRFLQLGDAIQVDVPVNSGNSGGPLIDKEGKLIGVIFAGIEQYEGLNFAIPAHWIHLILPDMYRGGKVDHPWIGTAIKKVGDLFKILYVMPGSPAEEAGIRKGDQITAINGKQFSSIGDYQREIIKHQKGTLISFSWKRGDIKGESYIALQSRPSQPIELAIKRDSRDNLITPLFGMELKETGEVFWKPNYKVGTVYQGSIIDEAGISEGDPISIQQWIVDEEEKVVIMQLFVMKRNEGFFEKSVQLAAYLELDNFI